MDPNADPMTRFVEALRRAGLDRWSCISNYHPATGPQLIDVQESGIDGVWSQVAAADVETLWSLSPIFLVAPKAERIYLAPEKAVAVAEAEAGVVEEQLAGRYATEDEARAFWALLVRAAGTDAHVNWIGCNCAGCRMGRARMKARADGGQDARSGAV